VGKHHKSGTHDDASKYESKQHDVVIAHAIFRAGRVRQTSRRRDYLF
jgi:hypothetical protein